MSAPYGVRSAKRRERCRQSAFRRFRVRCVGALLTLILSALAHGVELHPADGGAWYRYGWCVAEVGSNPPERLSQTPAYRSLQPRYLALRLGQPPDGVLTGVLDEAGGTGAGYDTLYLDANNNGDLTDDRVIRPTLKQTGAALAYTIDPVEMLIRYAGGATRRLRVELEIHGYRASRSRVYWSAGCQLAQHLAGRIDIGERKNVLLGLYDSTQGPIPSNGRFCDYGVDRLRIDLDGDGVLDAAAENFPLSKVIALDGRLWEVETDSRGSRLDVRPCRLPTGEVTFAFRPRGGSGISGGRIEVVSAHQGYALSCPMADRATLALPEGRYHISRATVLLADKSGTPWEATFSLPRPFTVHRGRTVAVGMNTFGAPFRLEPRIRGALRTGRSVCIMPRMTGIAGEVYENIAPEKTRMAPQLEIFDSADIRILSAKMEYG
ncbi:MAG: hypothetical protein JXR37_25135 [Kiritimatiellae bacterium]|nr:hypothetical protein [Kiritimatiellia bacterium]